MRNMSLGKIKYVWRLQNTFKSAMMHFGYESRRMFAIGIGPLPGNCQTLAFDGDFNFFSGHPGEFRFDDEFARGVHQHIDIWNPERRFVWIRRHLNTLLHT